MDQDQDQPRHIKIKKWTVDTYQPLTIVSIGHLEQHEIHNMANALYNVVCFPELKYTYLHNDVIGSENILKHAEHRRYHVDDVAGTCFEPTIIFAEPFWDYGNKTNMEPTVEATFFGDGEARPKNILYVQLITFVHTATLHLDRIDYVVLSWNSFYEKRLYDHLQLDRIFGDYHTYSAVYRELTENGDKMVLDMKGSGLDAVFYIPGCASAKRM
jgi:hypothetical protein